MMGIIAYPVDHGDSDPIPGSRFKDIFTALQPLDATSPRFDGADDPTPVSDLQSFIKRKIPRGPV
jgi:hypothetical protein